MLPDLPIKELSLNRVQLTSVVQNANIDVCITGRGGGKSNKKAWRYHQLVKSMPMSFHGVYSKTFKSLLTNTVGPLLEGMTRLGYHRDIHYTIGHKPPSGWEIAPNAPAKFDYVLSFRNGAAWRIMSEDREDSWRGPSINSVDADEGLLLNKTKFENGPLMANRGDIKRFGNNPLHHGICIDSSMPTSANSQWLLDFGKYYEEDDNRYWLIWNRIVKLQLEFLNSNNDEEQLKIAREWTELRKQIVFYKKVINSKQGTTVLFSFFNVFDNIKNVGLDFILNAKRIMSPISFRIEMLNEKINAIEDCFYNINEDVHLYDAHDYSLIDKMEYDFTRIKSMDSRADRDVDINQPLDIAIDYGHYINAMRIGQEHRLDLSGNKQWQYRYLKSLFVRPPDGIPQLVESFCTYYSLHRKKKVLLWHDHTEVGGEGWRVPHINETMIEMRKAGWDIETKYIGRAPEHRVKHLLWFVALSETDERFPKIRFNRENDKEGILSMQLAGMKQGNKGIQKDKSSEKKKTIPREQATDLSDAADLLLVGRYGHLLNATPDFIGFI
jgi:hypothetical protein